MNISKVFILCGLIKSTLGNEQFEPALQSSWEAPLLVIGLVFGFAAFLFHMVRTHTTPSNPSQMTVFSGRISTQASRGDNRSIHSAYVSYERPHTFKERCCGCCTTQKDRHTGSLKTVPSFDIPDDQYEVVVEKLIMYTVPLAVTAVAEDVVDYKSIDSLKNDIESILAPEKPPSKKKSHSTLSSYYAVIPAQPTLPSEQLSIRSAYAMTDKPDAQSTSTYFDVVPKAVTSQQSAPPPNIWTKPVQSEVFSTYSTTPAAPLHVAQDAQSTSTYYDMVPKAQSVMAAGYGTRPADPSSNKPPTTISTYFDNALPAYACMHSQQSTPLDNNYGAASGQPDRPASGMNDTQSVVTYYDMVPKPAYQDNAYNVRATHESAPMKGEPHSTPQYGGVVPSLEQGKDHGPRYMSTHANRTPQVAQQKTLYPKSVVLPEVQTTSYFGMVPQPLPQSLEEQEPTVLKPPQTVVHSYFASVGPHTMFDKHTENLGSVGKIRSKSRQTLTSQPYLVATDSSAYEDERRQTTSFKEFSQFSTMGPKPCRSKATNTTEDWKSPGRNEKMKKTLSWSNSTEVDLARTTQPSTPMFMDVNGSTVMQSGSRSSHLNNVSSTTTTPALSRRRPTPVPVPVLQQKQVASLANSSRDNNKLARTTQPSTPMFMDVNRSTVMQSGSRSSHLNNVSSTTTTPALSRRRPTPVPVLQQKQVASLANSSRNNKLDGVVEGERSGSINETESQLSNSESRTIFGEKRKANNIGGVVEGERSGSNKTEPQLSNSESHTIFGEKRKVSVLQASSMSNVRPSNHEPAVVTMSSGHLVPTTDEERQQMNQYLNQFSSIFTYNLKDPIPKDPETFPGSSVNDQRVETRTSLAESLSQMGATEYSSRHMPYSHATPSTSRDQRNVDQYQPWLRRSRTSGSDDKYVYSSQIDTFNQELNREGGQHSSSNEKQGTNISDIISLQKPFHDDMESIICKSSEALPSTDKNAVSNFDEKSNIPNALPPKERPLSKQFVYVTLDSGSRPNTMPIKDGRMSKEMSCEFLDGTLSEPKNDPIHASGTSKETSCDPLDGSLSEPKNVPVQASGMSKEIGCAMLDGSFNDRKNKLIQASGMSKEIGCAMLDGSFNDRKNEPIQASGMSKEIGCAMLDGSFNDRKNEPIQASGMSKEIGCAMLDGSFNDRKNEPIQASGMSKEMGCTSLDSSSKPENVPIRVSGMSKEIGCANLDGTSADNTSSEKPPGNIPIAKKSSKSDELACQDLSDTTSNYDKILSAEKHFFSPSASEKVEHLYEYDLENSFGKMPTDIQSAHSVYTERDTENTMTKTPSSPIPSTGSLVHSRTSHVDESEPHVHDSLKSIMAPAKLGASSSVIDTRQLLPEPSIKSILSKNENNRGGTLSVAFSDKANTCTFSDTAPPLAVSAGQSSDSMIKPPGTASQGSAYDDYEGATKLVDRPSETSQSSKGATLRWKIIIKHRPDDPEPRCAERRSALRMLEPAATTDESQPDLDHDESTNPQSRDAISDDQKD